MSNELMCTFFLEGNLFGVPVALVQEVIRSLEMTRVPLAPAAVSGMLNLRGQIVTAIDLRRRLRLAERSMEESPMHVVVRTPDGLVSLLVDEVGEVVEVSEARFEVPPENLQGQSRDLVRGVYKLDERLLLALDTEQAVTAGDAGRPAKQAAGT
jgi:purine-binding chemotaxis protein CheW